MSAKSKHPNLNTSQSGHEGPESKEVNSHEMDFGVTQVDLLQLNRRLGEWLAWRQRGATMPGWYTNPMRR